MAGLVSRQRTNKGIKIEVPLASASFAAFEGQLLQKSLGTTDQSSNEYIQSMRYRDSDRPNQSLQKIDAFKSLIFPLNSTTYECADGRKVYVSFYFNRKFSIRLFRALGIYNKVRDEGFVIESAWNSELTNNVHNLAKMTEDRKRHLCDLIRAAFLARTAEEWEDELGKVGVPAALVRTRQEWLELMPIRNAGILTTTRMVERELITPVPYR